MPRADQLSIEGAWTVLRFETEPRKRLRFGRIAEFYDTHQSWVGNIFWDGVVVSVESARRIATPSNGVSGW